MQTLAMMDQGRFTFRTLKQGRDLNTLLSNAFPEAGKIVMGLVGAGYQRDRAWQPGDHYFTRRNPA